MVEFRNTLLHCGLIDLGFSGYPYTWRNGRPDEALVEERLDRACATLVWSELFPTTKVIHLNVSYSNHDPLLLDTAPSTPNHHCGHHIQRFEEKWVSHPECEAKIRKSWTQAQTSGSPMHCLFKKIKKCRSDLVAWSRIAFGDTRDHLDRKQKRAGGVDREWLWAEYGHHQWPEEGN